MSIAENCARVRERMHNETIHLICVSKTHTSAEIREAYDAGECNFGENYVQEALAKMPDLIDCDITWHFIGALQGNKLRQISQHFTWVHTLDKLSHAERLNHFCEINHKVMNVCIQVNIDGEDSKAGVFLADIKALAHAIAGLPNLRCRGLMCIPKATGGEQRKSFSRLAQAQAELNRDGFQYDTLSMGMSGDYLDAISEGATMVRIGSAIFGERVKLGSKNSE